MIAAPQTARRTRLRFLLKLIVYTLPFALPFLLLSGFMIYTGEAMPLEMVARMQMSDQPILYRPRYGNRDLDFKVISANLRQPEIMTVGSSRVLQFRSLFFDKQPQAFYNGGAPAWTLDTVIQLLDRLTFTPKILIIGLDQPWFNEAYVPDVLPDQVSDFTRLFQANRSFMQDVIGDQSFDIGRYLARVEPGFGGMALGLRAIRDGHGFRNDGSEQYGDFLVAHFLSPANERKNAFELLRVGHLMYVEGDTLWASRLQQLQDLLIWCKARGITVIGFQPSFMPTLYQQMMADGKHSYIQKLDDVFPLLFPYYGDYYFNFADGAQLGATDEDFFDGWHASEKINLRLYEQMLKALPDVLGAYSDPEVLQAAEAGATDTFNVFGNRTK
ncbi:MAG: hypothetical protein GC204_01055 [Chloroflexi bacterium]|nr:hypothetical protein [Chloroflexota bacterium]